MNLKVLISAIFASLVAVAGCDSSSGSGTGGSGGTAGSGGAGGAPVARDCDNLPDLGAYAITDAPATDAVCTPPIFNDTSATAGANLQLRIDDASTGDVVCIAPGTYNLDRLIAIAREPITLQGTGNSPDDVVLRFGGAGSIGGISSTLPDVTVENFWVQNAPANCR